MREQLSKAASSNNNTQNLIQQDSSSVSSGVDGFADMIDEVFVRESVSEFDGLSYLDVVTTIGGGVVKEKVLRSIDMCGGSARVGIGRKSGKYMYMPNYCKLIYCPDCSREGGPIERIRMGRVFDRVDVENENLRALFLTVPYELRVQYFMTRKGVNALLKMGTKIAGKVFGKDSRMIVVPHLVGDKESGYNPHVNVLMFEEKGTLLKVGKEVLDRLRDLWKQALEGYCRVKIPVVDVFYEFKTKLYEKLHLIRYTVRANFTYDEKTVMLISSDEFRRFQWVRFRGSLRKKGEKDMCDNEIEKGGIEEQVGEEIQWLGTVSMKELKLRFGDIELEPVSGKYEIYRETDAAQKKRKRKILKFG